MIDLEAFEGVIDLLAAVAHPDIPSTGREADAYEIEQLSRTSALARSTMWLARYYRLTP